MRQILSEKLAPVFFFFFFFFAAETAQNLGLAALEHFLLCDLHVTFAPFKSGRIWKSEALNTDLI